MEEPAPAVARGIYESQAEDGDRPFDDLGAEERQDLIDYCGIAIGLHAQWLSEKGFRIVPPGDVPRPKTDEEAAAMVQAVKVYQAAKARKGGLVGSVAPKKLILPPGTH